MKRHVVFILVLCSVVMALVACQSRFAYDHYRSVSIDGWNRTDTLDFVVGRIPSGNYDMSVGFRATSEYPYKELGFDITCSVYATGRNKPGKAPKAKTIHKRVKCSVFNDNGQLAGRGGISTDDFIYSVGDLSVSNGDSVVVCIAHGMNQDVMPGITQVGLQLEKK